MVLEHEDMSDSLFIVLIIYTKGFYAVDYDS